MNTIISSPYRVITTSTILTLFVVPVTYILFDDISNKLKSKIYKNNDI